MLDNKFCISIIGSGVVGYTIGKGFKQFGNNVLFFDIDKNKIENFIKEGLHATTNIELTIKTSDIFFICVPTPNRKDSIDLDIIKFVIRELSKLYKNKNDYFLVVIKSTVTPMTTEKIIVPLIEEFSYKKVGKDFGVCFNPEFLRDACAYEDFMSPDRIVIGEFDKKSGDILEELYSPFKCPIIRTDLRTAEMSKYANNCFYATKISFFNEIHLMCQKINIDSDIIRKIVQMDRFYGTHPWKHGHSFGGKCLPKDLDAIITFFVQRHVYDPILLETVRKINDAMKNKYI